MAGKIVIIQNPCISVYDTDRLRVEIDLGLSQENGKGSLAGSVLITNLAVFFTLFSCLKKIAKVAIKTLPAKELFPFSCDSP